MPGPEWNNDEPGTRDDSRPLDGPEAAPSFAPFTPFVQAQAHAQTTEPAMAHVSPQQDPDHDQDETESDETPKPSAFFKALRLLKKIPLPSLGSERHEMLSHVNRTHAAEPRQAEPRASHSPARSAPKFSLFHLKRETRVGIMALISFVIIVTALVVKKGWIGGTPMLAMDGPVKTDAEVKKDAEAKKDPEVKKEPEPKPAGEPASTDKPSTDLPPIGTGESKPTDPVVTPRSEGDSSKLPPAVTDASSNSGLTLPESAARTVDLPPANGGDSMLPPVTGSEPKPTPTPTPTPTIPETAPSTLPDPKDLLPPAGEAKAALPEINPGAGSGLPAIPSKPAEPPPSPQPAAPGVVPDLIGTSGTTQTTPVPSEKTPPLESVPSGLPAPTASAPIEPAATTTSMGGTTAAPAAANAATPGDGWIVIPSGGRRIPGASPIVSTPMDSDFGQVDRPVATASRVTDGPRPSQPLDADQVDPVFHTVEPGENFWTISKLYYNSPRYYKALHAANKQQVPNIAKLYIGTVLQIPPPEKLDRALIDRETTPVTKVTKKANPDDLADLAPPIRPRIARPDPEAPEPPRRPTYKVKPNDTLRSIAREMLGDSRRDKEIFTLNNEILDNPRDLAPGTILTLPEDAKIARGGR